jgi:hypothetical protein
MTFRETEVALAKANQKIERLHKVILEEVAKQSFNSGVMHALAGVLSKATGESVDISFLDTMVKRLNDVVQETK